MPLPLTASCFSKIQMVLPFWYRLTWVVPDKGPLNGCMYHREFGVFLFGDSVEWFCSVDVFWGFVDIACDLGGRCENPLIWRHGSMFQPNCWDGAMKLLWNFRWLSTAVHYTTDVTQDFWLFCSIHESYIVYLCGVGENFFAVKFYGDTQVSFIILLCSNIIISVGLNKKLSYCRAGHF